MAQLFSRRSNSMARAAMLGFVVLICASGWVLHAVYWSPWTTREMTPIEQPVPFSHKHHVYGLGIDCRFCHTTVESSAFAGMPSTTTCLTCHSQIWKDAPLLAPLHESLARGTPLHWTRVHDTPDFVFFNHGIHIDKGIGCTTCHQHIDQMPLTSKSANLYMKWCLECHRQPDKYVRPREEVFNVDWPLSATNGLKLVQQYHIQTQQLTDCSMCHR